MRKLFILLFILFLYSYSYAFNPMMVCSGVPVVSGGSATEVLRPASSDVVAQWTPSEVSDHYALVDETETDDDDYIETSLAKVELWNLEDTSDSSGKTINSITFYARIKRTGGDGTTDVHLHLYTSSSYYDGDTEIGIGTSYETISHTWTTDPSDSNSWTSAEIDALWVGLESTGADETYTCPQYWVGVDYVP